MLGVVPEVGTSAFRLWVAAGSAALLVVLCGLAFFRLQASPGFRAGSVVLAAIFGAAITWVSLDDGVLGDRGAERRSLELRAEELGARALVPGSPLACLDALAGDSVETACEKALFVSPASVASASSYIAARLTLLSAMVAYAERSGAELDYALLPLRRSLEADRFGFLAHVLAVRDGCTSRNCKALALLHDASRVRADLDAQMLDHYLEHYQELWAKALDGTPAEAQAQPSVTAQSNAPGPRRIVNIDFPSAASIPAVSIMYPEPTGPVLPGLAAAAAANPNPQQATAPPRHARKPAAGPSVQSPGQPAASSAPAVEPIWPEPLPPPPPQAAVPAGAPVQLNPPSPSASAGPTVRAQ
jgi:hypothetical protein